MHYWWGVGRIRRKKKISIQTHERFKSTLFIRTKHSMRIFGLIPFTKLQNDTETIVKWRTVWCRAKTLIYLHLVELCSVRVHSTQTSMHGREDLGFLSNEQRVCLNLIYIVQCKWYLRLKTNVQGLLKRRERRRMLDFNLLLSYRSMYVRFHVELSEWAKTRFQVDVKQAQGRNSDHCELKSGA